MLSRSEDPAPAPHIKITQTCRKSTSGIKRQQQQSQYNTAIQTSRRTSDSLLTSTGSIDEQQSNNNNTTKPLGLKLVFKRQSGDKYEISSSSPLSSSGNAEQSSKKVSI